MMGAAAMVWSGRRSDGAAVVAVAAHAVDAAHSQGDGVAQRVQVARCRHLTVTTAPRGRSWWQNRWPALLV